MKYLVNHFLALIMQLKVKVTSRGQGHVHFTTEQCTMNVWAYFTAYGTMYRTEVKVTKTFKIENLTQLKK